jgi:translation initiation factor 2 alpha subunit (eIF-2alpha)
MNIEQIRSPERIYSEREVAELFRAIAGKKGLTLNSLQTRYGKKIEDERGLLFLRMEALVEGGETLVLEYVRRPLKPSLILDKYIKALARYPRIDMELGSNYPEHVATIDKETGEWKFI